MRALACAAALLVSSPAWAVYQCGDTVDSCQCGAANPYPCCSNGGNCTWYAWEAACCSWGVGLPSWGNANQWAGNASANAHYTVLGYPVTNAVSCRTLGTYGHVAFVKGLSGSTVTVDEQNCWGNYGKDTANYASTFFQGYITRAGQTQCHPGDSQTQACGRCGTQHRGCATDGTWNAWGACGGEGACMPGDSQSEACGDCGSHSRACSTSCQWAPWPSSCGAGADPDGGTVACDTGQLGACADGRLRCGDGGMLGCEPQQAPTAETCDGVDNDCNGVVDDGLFCFEPPGLPRGGDSSAQPNPDSSVTPEPGLGPAQGGCAAAGGGLSASLLSAGLAALLRRRRARSTD